MLSLIFTMIFDATLHASSGIGGGNQASREIPLKFFTLHCNLEIYAKGFVSSFIHHQFIIIIKV